MSAIPFDPELTGASTAGGSRAHELGQEHQSAALTGRKLRVGIIGPGAFAAQCHIPCIQSHPDAEVVALCGRRIEPTRAMADEFGVPEVMTDYRELCERDDIDAVTIATPPAFHAEQAIAACAAGKHVFCEKPFSVTVAEARAMRDAAERSDRVHMIGFTFRYGYGVRELRRRVQAGEIGQPVYHRIQYDGWWGLGSDWKMSWREIRDVAGGGMLFDLGSHLFDLAHHIIGPIELVTGFALNIPRERVEVRSGQMMNVETDDITEALLIHASGVHGRWFTSRATPMFTQNGYLEVIGTEGALRAGLSNGKADSLKISRPDEPDWRDLPLPDEAYDGGPHSLGIMMRSFVDACLRGQIDPDVDATFDDGFANQQALVAVLSSSRHPEWVPIAAR